MALLDDVRTLAEKILCAIGEVGTPDGGVLQRNIPHYVREEKTPREGGQRRKEKPRAKQLRGEMMVQQMAIKCK